MKAYECMKVKHQTQMVLYIALIQLIINPEKKIR